MKCNVYLLIKKLHLVSWRGCVQLLGCSSKPYRSFRRPLGNGRPSENKSLLVRPGFRTAKTKLPSCQALFPAFRRPPPKCRPSEKRYGRISVLLYGKRPSESVFSDGLCIALSAARPDIYGSVWGVSMILESGFAILGKR